MEYVKLEEVVRKMNLKSLTPQIDISDRKVWQTEVNRLALELTGYFDHFAAGRIQIIGLVEHSYIEQMKEEDKKYVFEKLFSLDVPMVVFTREMPPEDLILRTALEKKMPLYLTNQATSPFMAEMIRWLNVRLAPCISIHGVLVDVYGVGVLLTGDSGVGKSEVALELIKRGHRLVSDDVVEIRRVSEETLIGTAPPITKHFIELRGIGIIDVKTLFGVSSVRETQNIDLEIHLEEWDRNREYDRLGLEETYSEYLGNKIVCHRVPVRPGRNVAIICEAAAANHRQKLMGYNAAQELYKRVQSNFIHGGSRDEEEW
ncbi:MAG: HPr(Ser) kinase/phosphatase [Eubacteriales bacterium]|nr:HPr(Ser) kinase/phosphatase [Eubacteriales bacterium]